MSRTALLFPGQGSQRPGMGVALAGRSPAAREVFRHASEALGWDVLETCERGSMAHLTRGDVAQPAIVAVGVACYEHLAAETDVRPDFMAGHSLGEIAALACAGVFDLATALHLAQVRGALMREAALKAPGVMYAMLGLPQEEVAAACAAHDRPGSRVGVSNDNAPGQLVISGHRSAVEAVCRSLSGSGVKTRPLEVEGAFHSPLMAEAAERFGETLEGTQMREPSVPVLSSVTARPHTRDAVRFLLKRQVVETVRWRGCFDFLLRARVGFFLECGPGNVLTRLARRMGPEAETFSLDEAGAVPPDRLSRRGAAGDFLSLCLAAAAASPNRGADPETFCRVAAPAYRELEGLRLRVLEEARDPSAVELSRSMALAERILGLKQAQDRLAELRTFARNVGIPYVVR